MSSNTAVLAHIRSYQVDDKRGKSKMVEASAQNFCLHLHFIRSAQRLKIANVWT